MNAFASLPQRPSDVVPSVWKAPSTVTWEVLRRMAADECEYSISGHRWRVRVAGGNWREIARADVAHAVHRYLGQLKVMRAGGAVPFPARHAAVEKVVRKLRRILLNMH